MDENYLLGIIPSEEGHEFEEEMLRRNLKWLGKIIGYHKHYSQEMIIAVGYDHLFGKNGILSLLAHEGFTLKRMNTTGSFIEFNLW